MILFPCAKINIGLRILSKRPDGYHNLQTLFLPIPLCDVLEIVPSSKGVVWDDGGWSNCPSSDNLVMRAYHLVKEEVPTLPDVYICLRKRIPVGAGLGGGSSDAAHTLLGLNKLFKLGISEERLQQLALKLGADVPFFLSPTPSIGEGIGEQLMPYPHLHLSGYYLTLLFPPIYVSTAEAYAGVTPTEEGANLLQALSLPIEEWKESVQNHFETSVFAKHPLLAELKATLYKSGATYAAMSGSGSTLFALSHVPLQLPSQLNIQHQQYLL